MITTAILNAILALGVIVMVVTPLVWAILTQNRDHPGLVGADRPTPHQPQRQPRRPAPRPSYTPTAGRA